MTPSIEDYYQFADYPPPSNFDDLAAEADDEAITYLTNAARRLRLEGVEDAETWLAHGRPEMAIIDYVQQSPYCLVAMTTHGRSGMGRWVLGSVAERVIRHSGVPVLVVRASEQEK